MPEVVVAESRVDPTMTLRVVEMLVVFAAGVTDSWLRSGVTPVGASDTPKLIGWLKLWVVMGTVVGADDPPEATVIGEIGPSVKSPELAGATTRVVNEHKPFDPPPPPLSVKTAVVMSVRVLLLGGASKSITNLVLGSGGLLSVNSDLSWIRSELPGPLEGSCTGQMKKG